MNLRRDDDAPIEADALPADADHLLAGQTPVDAVEDHTPAEERMGLVSLVLDKGVRTTAIGEVYGLDFDISGDRYRVRLFFDNYNRRLKVLDYEGDNYRDMVERVDWLADANGFTKVFIKARANDWQRFLQFGYQLEGILKYFYRGEDAFVMSRFRSVERAHNPLVIEEDDLISRLMARARQYDPKPLPEGYTTVVCGREHIDGLVELYREVFATYPSPLRHRSYVVQTMQRNVLYRAILDESGTIVSAASAEMDPQYSNAEMTDCATHKSQRGKSLMFHLLHGLLGDMKERGIQTPYTLARAASFGMNLVFYRLGFEYCGRLTNNCDIYGQFEDMNIWVLPQG